MAGNETTAPIWEGLIMVRYWYSLSPFIVILAVVTLALPWLGLIALMLFALVAVAALGALAWGIVFVPQLLARSARRRWRSLSDMGRQPAALSTARPHVASAESMPAAPVLLVSQPSESDRLT
jgi:hypothetical protein